MPIGMGRASEYAGWWSGGPAQVTMSSASTLGYEVYQTPSFSWDNTIGNGTYPDNTYISRLALGNVDLTGYTALAGYEKKRSTIMMTFKLNLPSGLTINQGIKQDTKFVGDDGDFTTNMAWVHGYGATVKLQINWPTGASIEMPATGYQAYNDRWLTIVGSSSDTYTNYTNWAGSTSLAANYARTAVYDTETGELIAKNDTANGTIPLGYPSNLTTWISNGGNVISTDRNDNYSWSISSSLPDTQPDCDFKIANFWVSFGTMWDPVTQKAAGETTWLTTRPNKTIGSAQAWFNGQFAGANADSGYTNVWSIDSDMDNFTPDLTGHGMDLIYNGTGNSTVFNDRYSTTDIPKSRG